MIGDPEKRFDGLPVKTEYIDGAKWKLAADVAYRIASGQFMNHFSTVRAGFIFDWASIPRVFWRIFPPTGLEGQPYGLAALWHDWAYVHQSISGIPCNRYDADLLFKEIMVYVGVSPWIAWTMFMAVRIGGGRAWAKNTKARSESHEQHGS